MRTLALVVAIAGCLAAHPALAQTKGFAENLKPDQQVEVNIAGYKYVGIFKGYVKCNDGGQCATILAADGGRTDTKLRFIHPAPATAAAAPSTAAKQGSAGGIALGKYTCAFFAGTLQTVPGFTLAAGGKFTDHKGSGTWREAGGVVSFTGSTWNGHKAKLTGNNKMQVLKENGSMGAVTCGLSK
jgi:hypothetical protein